MMREVAGDVAVSHGADFAFKIGYTHMSSNSMLMVSMIVPISLNL
ncbi:hypothetical protein ACP8HZ_00300 [Francisella noatunensis]